MLTTKFLKEYPTNGDSPIMEYSLLDSEAWHMAFAEQRWNLPSRGTLQPLFKSMTLPSLVCALDENDWARIAIRLTNFASQGALQGALQGDSSYLDLVRDNFRRVWLVPNFYYKIATKSYARYLAKTTKKGKQIAVSIDDALSSEEIDYIGILANEYNTNKELEYAQNNLKLYRK